MAHFFFELNSPPPFTDLFNFSTLTACLFFLGSSKCEKEPDDKVKLSFCIIGVENRFASLLNQIINLKLKPMRKVIALFALMAMCLMGAAKGLAPPGPDVGNEVLTFAIPGEVQADQVVLNMVDCSAPELDYLTFEPVARAGVLIAYCQLSFYGNMNLSYTLLPDIVVSDFPFTGLWQNFY